MWKIIDVLTLICKYTVIVSAGLFVICAAVGAAILAWLEWGWYAIYVYAGAMIWVLGVGRIVFDDHN